MSKNTRVQAICAVTHTSKVVSAYQAMLEAQRNP